MENGDLIWTPGHVMIINNLKNNTLVEARGYSSGYGCVHKITLDKVFAEINTYDDLIKYYYANKKITFKNKEGESAKNSVNFKLFKLID